jgi:hypothetical protein
MGDKSVKARSAAKVYCIYPILSLVESVQLSIQYPDSWINQVCEEKGGGYNTNFIV